MKKLLVLLPFLLLASFYVHATSTIDPTQPASGSALSSAPIRGNFGAAYNDINNLQAKFPVSVLNGGTGATTGIGALTNFGLTTNSVTTIPQSGLTPFGDDLTAVSDAGGATTRYINPLAASLGTAVNTNRGTAGAMAADVSDTQIFETQIAPPATGNPLYTVEVGANDAFYKGAGSYEAAVFRPSLKAALSWLAIPNSTKKFTNLGTCSHTGSGWGQGSQGGGLGTFNNINGETLTCTYTTNGPLYIWHQNSDAQPTSSFTYAIDGGAPVTVNTITSPSISTHNGLGVSQAVEEIDGLSNGSHSIVFTITTSSAHYSFIIALGTIPSSFPSTSPIVFASGVPFQFNNANSANTVAYDADVTTVVNGLFASGLPVYRMPIRTYVNSTTNMISSIFLSNSGQTNTAAGFLATIQPVIGGSLGTAISPASGGLGINASNSTGALSFSSGAPTIGNLGIGFGGTGASTVQGDLNNFFNASSGTAAPYVWPCTGTADQTSLAIIGALATAAQASVLVPAGCLLTGQYKNPSSGYFSLYGAPTSYNDINNGGYAGAATKQPIIRMNAANIAAAPEGAAIDMNATTAFSINNLNISGGGQTHDTLISSSVQYGGCCSSNIVSIQNSNIGAIGTAEGCATDESNDCLNTGAISAANSTIVPGTGYTPGKYQIIPLTGGSGTGATATFVTVGTTGIPTLSNIAGGSFYHVGDVLGIGTSVIGPGTGFSLTVNGVFGTGAISSTNPNGSGRAPLVITSGGTGYVTGTYSNVPLTGGTGSGAVASSITVNGSGVVSAVTMPQNSGTDYYLNDVLSASNTNLGGTGSGLQLTVNTLQAASGQAYILPHLVNTTVGNYNVGLAGTYTDAYVWGSDFGGGGPGIFGGGSDTLAGGTNHAGGASQVWNNRFEFTAGVWSFGGFDIIDDNNFTGNENAPWSLLLVGAHNGAVVGNNFDGPSTPANSSDVQIGMPRLNAGLGSNGGLAFVGNSMFTVSPAVACIDLEGTGDDYLNLEGNTCYGAGVPAVKFGSEHPAHASYSIVGQQGFRAWVGLPDGVGTDMPLGIGTATLDVEGTSAIHIPQGTTGERPSGPVEGLVRDNTTTHTLEAYTNGSWGSLVSNIAITPGPGISSALQGSTGPVGATGSLFTDASYFQMYKKGLILSNDSTTPNTILDIQTGVATSDDNTLMMKLASAFTKTTGSWTVGTGNGALDTGSVTTSTWYHVFVIERPDTQVVDILFSTSSWNPVMPSAYTQKRWVGAFKTNGSSNILAFKQKGNIFYNAASTLDVNDNAVTTTATLETLGGVPSGVKVQPLCRWTATNASANSVIMTSPDEADVAPGNALPIASAPGQDMTDETLTTGLANLNCPTVTTNSAGQVRVRGSASSTTVAIVTRGWIADYDSPISYTDYVTVGGTYTLSTGGNIPLWNTASNQVCGIAEGGNGATATASGTGGGGGGGAYACVNNLSDAAGTAETTTIGTGGTGTNTTFKAAGTLKAAFGANGTVSSAGAGGTTAGSTGSNKAAGGAGGAGTASTHLGGGGGGGAGGANGSGGVAAASSGATGGGGGGNSGGSAASTTTGGNNFLGTGGATIGLNGTVGGGGGGGNCCQGGISHAGGNGGNGIENQLSPAFGFGGGGGGGGGDNFGGGGGGNGGVPGTYGAGGGGGGGNGGAGGTGATGAPGLIIVKWLIP